MNQKLTKTEYRYICREIKNFNYTIKDIKYIEKKADSFGIVSIYIMFNNGTYIVISVNTCGPFKSCNNFSGMEENKYYTFEELDLTETLLEENEKLKNAIDILQKIYDFRLQDKKYSGFYELLIPDMTSDELTKEEYELLKEVL